MNLRNFLIFGLFLSIQINISFSACHNYRQISQQADYVSRDLENLYQEVRYYFPYEYNLQQFTRKAQVDAEFLYRLNQDGSMPCYQTKENYYNLRKSSDLLRNYFSNFSRRRNIRYLEMEWRRFIDDYKYLEIIMQNARENKENNNDI